MKAGHRYLRSVSLALRSALHQCNDYRRALTGRLRFGIVSCLAIALIGVGVLVLAANFIVEQGISTERTTEIVRTVPAPAIPPRVPETVPAPRIDPLPKAVPRPRGVSSDELVLALERFDHAAQNRIGTDAERSEGEYQRTIVELDRAADAFFAKAAALQGHPFTKTAASIKAYEKHCDELVRAADQRRAMMSDYLKLLESSYARVNDSVNSAWKVFGRVIARQSLVQLDRDFNTLRRSAAALQVAENAPAPDIQGLVEAEQAVLNNLTSNERTFRRVQGDGWYTGLHDDVARLIAMRTALLQSNEQLHDQARDLEQEGIGVAAVIPKKIEAPFVAAAHKAAAGPAAVKIDRASRARPLPSSNGGVPAAVRVESHSVLTSDPAAHSKRVVVAWVSVGVVVLLVLIAVGIAMSIVGPVRRLCAATVRLAQGDGTVRVRRGGIRELDTLAVAFNAMANELAIAKAAASDYQDSLEAKVAERTEQLQELAQRDPLTGLPNRRHFLTLLNAALLKAKDRRSSVGVYFLDIDNFKYLNDTMGHAFGDRLLVSLARRLHEATQSIGYAGRLGGDEFTVVCERAEGLQAIRGAGTTLVQAFQRPLSVDGREVMVSISVGASIYPEHGNDAEALLKAADAALFHAKAEGRNQLAVFTPKLLAAAAAKFTTEQRLRHAVERGEFELTFQPEVNGETLEAALVEALIRWRMADGTLASPEDFLAIAEESGLIVEISDWVLRSAIEAAARWHHNEWPEARVAINISPRQLLDPRFVDHLADLLAEYHLPARCIEIELTESVLQTGAATIDALKRLRVLGVAIALDDFGTGYSSLASLEQLPLTRIKLDRSLIAGIDTNPRSAAITRAIIGMCQGLGLEITAEGIERPAQFAALLEYSGLYLQGYLLARPVAREKVMGAIAEMTQRAQELLLNSQALIPPNEVEREQPLLAASDTA